MSSSYCGFRCVLAVSLLLAASEHVGAQEWPPGTVDLPVLRWRAVRQVVQDCAEQTGFRWAMPTTISRRVYLGDVGAAPAAKVIQDLSKQSGLQAAKLNGVLVIHEPSVRLKELTVNAGNKDRRTALAAIVELGWLRDARAWPVLAKIAVSDDVGLALAAAQALRRLDGEKALDARLYGISAEDPEFRDIDQPLAPWQAPLGLAFPGCVDGKDIERLATSQYVPLREAAARLTASQGDKGKDMAEKLVRDASPLVRAAAERTLQAWSKAEPIKGHWIKKPTDGSKPWWLEAPPDPKAAADALANAKDHDTIWRLLGRRFTYRGSPEAIRVMIDYGKSGAKWNSMSSRPLAEWGGGPEVITWLKAEAARHSDYGGHQGWALWGLTALQAGEQLAKSLRPALEARAHWSAPPEYTAAYGAGIHAQEFVLARLETRGHWVCRALGYIGGPKATEVLVAHLDHKDPGVAVAAAKGLGDCGAHAGIAPLIAQLKHEDRLRRHWAVLGLAKIGGPDAVKALVDLLRLEEKRQDRLVRIAAATALREIGATGDEERMLIERAFDDDKRLVPEYRPRNPRFDASFPVNTEVTIKEHKPSTYCSIGETRAAMDWANRLLFRYGGCTPCYSNEMFAFDIGTSTWFPIRAADHYCDLFAEVRPNPGCSRGMTYDGLNKWVWIGQGIGSSTGPTQVSHNRRNGLAAYDAALDRFLPCVNASRLPQAYSGEPSKAFAFDYDSGLLFGSRSGGPGIGVVDTPARQTRLLKAPDKMPSWDQYRPPAFAYDPVLGKILCTHPDLGWKLLAFDQEGNTFRVSESTYPGKPSKQIMGGLVYDSVNREMLLIGGVSKDTGAMPTCLYDRKKDAWIDLGVKNLGAMGVGQDTCVFDPEHNVVLELIRGVAYRYRDVPVGTKAYYGGQVGQK